MKKKPKKPDEKQKYLENGDFLDLFGKETPQQFTKKGFVALGKRAQPLKESDLPDDRGEEASSRS